MKKIIFFTIGCCFLSQVHAQSLLPVPTSQNPGAAKHFRMLRTLLKQQSANTVVEKPTAIKQRVIAQVRIDDSGTDSVTFRYSGTRGSSYDFNNMEISYRDYFSGFYDPGEFIYGPAPSSMLADSIAGYGDNGPYDLDYAYYRNDNQTDSVFEADVIGGVLSNGYKYIKVYDAQSHLSQVYELHYGVAGYDTIRKQGIYYNNDFSQVLSDTSWIHPPTGFEIGGSNQYYYNAAGKLDSFIVLRILSSNGPLEPTEKTVITYYADGRLQTVTGYNMPNLASQEIEYRDTFAYTPGIDYYTEWTEEYWFGGNVEESYRVQQIPGANGLPDSLLASGKESNTDPWELQATLIYQYNSYNNPLSADIHFTDGSTSGQMAFYYEEYEDGDTTIGIEPIALNNDFRIYPNPFSGQISIDYSGKNLKNPLHLSLTNVLGQSILERNIYLRKGSNTISLPEMAPGNYYLILKTEDGRYWTQQLLKR